MALSSQKSGLRSRRGACIWARRLRSAADLVRKMSNALAAKAQRRMTHVPSSSAMSHRAPSFRSYRQRFSFGWRERLRKPQVLRVSSFLMKALQKHAEAVPPLRGCFGARTTMLDAAHPYACFRQSWQSQEPRITMPRTIVSSSAEWPELP